MFDILDDDIGDDQEFLDKLMPQDSIRQLQNTKRIGDTPNGNVDVEVTSGIKKPRVESQKGHLSSEQRMTKTVTEDHLRNSGSPAIESSYSTSAVKEPIISSRGRSCVDLSILDDTEITFSLDDINIDVNPSTSKLLSRRKRDTDNVCRLRSSSVVVQTCDIKTRNAVNIERSSREVERNNRPVISDSSKRIFPGPAGALPKLSPMNLTSDVRSLRVITLHDPVGKNQELDVVSNMDLTCSQTPIDYFETKPWLAMVEDLSFNGIETNAHVIQKYNIDWVLKQDSRKSFLEGKIPALCVVLHSLVANSKGDISAVFRDPTGKMSGTIHRDLNNEYGTLLKPGCVLVLREIGVFTPTPRKKYLNITPRNIVHIYFLTDKEAEDHSYLSTVRWNDFVRNIKDMLARPAVLEPWRVASPTQDCSTAFIKPSSKQSRCLSPGISPRMDRNISTPPVLHCKKPTPNISSNYSNHLLKSINVCEKINSENCRSRDVNINVTNSFEPVIPSNDSSIEGASPCSSNCRPSPMTSAKNTKFTFRRMNLPSVASAVNNDFGDFNSHDTPLKQLCSNAASSLIDEEFWANDDFDAVLREIDVDQASKHASC